MIRFFSLSPGRHWSWRSPSSSLFRSSQIKNRAQRKLQAHMITQDDPGFQKPGVVCLTTAIRNFYISPSSGLMPPSPSLISLGLDNPQQAHHRWQRIIHAKSLLLFQQFPGTSSLPRCRNISGKTLLQSFKTASCWSWDPHNLDSNQDISVKNHITTSAFG